MEFIAAPRLAVKLLDAAAPNSEQMPLFLTSLPHMARYRQGDPRARRCVSVADSEAMFR
jgi:hypothetical protein